MFPNLKDLYQLKKQASDMQRQLAEEIIESTNHGIAIKMNGNQEALSVALNPELSKDDQEKYLCEAINDCLKQVKELMAKTMMQSGFMP